MKKKRKICLLLSPLLFVSLLASCQVAGSDEIDGNGEWYGLGFQVDQACRKDYLIGETPSVNDYSGLGYDGGDEVKVKSSELTVEPSRPLTEEDKTLTFTWKGNKTGKEYRTTWNINVAKKLISQCEKMDKAPVKYIEPEHTLNHNGTEVDPTSEDSNVNKIDTYAATTNGIQNVNFGEEEECLDSVSDGSRFEFNYTAIERGFIHIYASVASNAIEWSGQFPTDYGNGKTGSIAGSKALDLESIVTIKNNDNVIDTKKYADIEETVLTKEIMKPYVESKSFNNWYSPLYAATHNFERKWLGVVPLEVGINHITLDLKANNMSCPWAYKQIACGNWDYIELDYVGEKETYNPTSLQVLHSKNDYLYGDTYDKSALEILASDENGVMEEVNPNDVTLNEALELSQQSIKLSYKGASIDQPVNVSTGLHCELGEDESSTSLVKAEGSKAKKAKVTYPDSNRYFISNISKGDSFKFTYNNTKNLKGKFAIYGDIASDDFIWQSLTDLFPEIKNGGSRFSHNINLKNRIKVTNNGVETALDDILIKGRELTSDTDLAASDPNYLKDAWYASYHWTCEQFEKVKIAEVNLQEGVNDIEISFPYELEKDHNGGNGNWAALDFYLLDETIIRTPKAIVTTSKANSFLFGEKFSLDGYSFSVEYNDGYLEGIDNSDVTIVDTDTTLDIGQTEVKLRYKETEFSAPIIVTDTLTTNLGLDIDATSSIYNYGKVKYVKGEKETEGNHAQKADGNLGKGSYLEKVTVGSYFEIEIDSPSDDVSVVLSGEVATNAFIIGNIDTADAPFEEYYGEYLIKGSNDLDLTKAIDLTNTVGQETTKFDVNSNAIASGHMITSEDADLANESFGRLDENGAVKTSDKWNAWGFGTYLATEQFENITIGKVILKRGKNTIRLTFKDGGQAHGAFSAEGVACGNWKSITMNISK